MKINAQNRYQYLFIVCRYSFNSSNSIRVDFFRNIEYTVTHGFREYITQTKDLPSNVIIPQIENEVTLAPIIKNTKNWLSEIKDYASNLLKRMIPLNGSLNTQILFPIK